MHWPYQCNIAINAAIKKGLEMGVDGIGILGDGIDFYHGSSFCIDPTRARIPVEVQRFHKFLDVLCKLFPNAYKYYVEGNHEMRLERYAMKHAPALVGLHDLTIENILKTEAFGFQYIRTGNVLKAGNLNIIHGHQYKYIEKNVSPAKGVFNRAHCATIIGHCHIKSEFSMQCLDKKQIVTFSTGCLCELYPDFEPHSKWQHGFSVIERKGEDHFRVYNYYVDKEGNVY